MSISRSIKILALVLVGLVAVTSVLAGGALLLARTSWGSERIRRFALPRVNAEIAGRIDVRRLAFSGNRIVLDEATLRAPDGELVARVGRVDVSFSPLALLHRRVNLRTVTLDAPFLSLRTDKDGQANLARALAARDPVRPREAGPAASSSPGAEQGLSVELGHLSVRGGVVELRDGRADAPPARRYVRVADLNVNATGHIHGDAGAFGLRLELRANATAPLRAPIALIVNGNGVHRPALLDARADIDLRIADSNVHANGNLQSATGPAAPGARPVVRVTVNLERARIEPSLVRLMAPGSSLKAVVTATGRGTWDGGADKAAAHLDLAAAGASVAVTASVDLDRRSLDGLSVRARDIDLGRLMVDGPPSDLSFELDAHGAGHDLATLRGAATVQLPPGRLGGYAIGPIRLRADADRGRYKVMDLLGVIPGISVTGAGEITADTIAFRAALDVRDLGATVKSVTAGSSSGTPRAGGRGRLDLTLSGNPFAPSLHVEGRLTALTWQDIHVPTLVVSADVPDLRTPLASTLNLKVPEADVGARRFRGLVVALRAAGPRFDAQISLTAPEALRLDVGGVWGRGRTQIVFDRLTLASRQATWKLTPPMRLSFPGQTVRVEGLDLRAEGEQRVRVDLEKNAGALRAAVALSAIDLARLPSSLLPPKLKLAGRLSADITVKGRADRPAVVARATLADGRVGNLRDIGLSMEARLEDRRVSGHLDLTALGAQLTGRFALPVAWPPPAASPLLVDVTASNVDLKRIMNGLRSAGSQLSSGASTMVVEAPPTDVRGVASLHVKVGGTGALPQMNVQTEVKHLEVGATPVGDVTIGVEAAERKPIAARLELRQGAGADGLPLAGPGVVVVHTAFSLGTLIHHPPTLARVLATPVEIEAHLDGVRLAPLAVLARYPRKVAGTASLELKLEGTMKNIRGKIDLGLTGVSTGQFPPTDAVLHLALAERDMRVDASVTRRATTLFSLTAQVDAPATRLRDPESLADVPIQLHAVLGPLDLQRVGLPPETDRRPARTLKGRLRAQADLTGTLRAPRLAFRADASDIRMDQTMLGNGVVLVSYADRKIAGDVSLVSGNGGRLHLVASTSADLGYPAITRGIDPRRLVLTAHLAAKGFDLSGLSGITPGLRSVAGQLFADVDVSGTAADPRVGGRLEWKEGGLTVTGMGEYKHIHLLAHGDKDHLVLDELRTDSGGGRARVTASGDRHVGSGYAIRARLALDDFPAYVDGQALAAISLQAAADTEVSVRRVRGKIAIDSARLALSDAKRKHLQKLAGPPDVVLTDGGAPLNPAQARKLAAVAAAMATPESRRAAAAVTAAHQPAREPPGVILQVDAPRNLWVKGKDANLELGLQPGFRVEITDVTRVYGQIIIKRGRADVVGRRFDLKAGSSVRFIGPPDAPELDLSAKHLNEKENITVLVTVSGSPGHLQIGISAPDRPDLTETQLYTLIVTGRLSFGGGTATSSTPTDQAASLVGGLMAAQLQKGLAKKLPLDVLTIDAGNGIGAARLEAGRYVTSDLYVGYVGRLGADPALLQNRNAVHLEYELGSRWSFQGEYGDAKTGSADMIWTKRY